jgi:hypothetical protein
MKTANKHPLQILVSKFPDATIKRIMIVDTRKPIANEDLIKRVQEALELK